MVPSSRRDRARGAFLGGMLGDAVGRPFEMSGLGDARLPVALAAHLAGSGPWRGSDDTDMMLAVAESLVRLGTIARDAVRGVTPP